jgi:hypothetical protein
MDDPLPFPPALNDPVPGSCSHCGLLTDLKPLNEHLSSLLSSKVSAVIDRFLSNNHPLPSETREEIASSLEPNAASLEKVDEAVTRLSDLLDGLKAARDALADRVQRSRSILHPLRILPDECLSNIFSHCITPMEGQDDDLFYGIPPHLFVNSPRALTYISRHWRDVALNMPKLWSNIVIDFSKAGDDAFWEPGILSILNLRLTRSTTHPLDVVIYSAYNLSVTDPLLQGVMAHCHRWRRLYLIIPFESFGFLQQVYHNLPVLEHVFIQYSVRSRVDPPSQDAQRRVVTEWDDFTLAANLRSICIVPLVIQETFGYCPQLANRIKKYRTIFCDPRGLFVPPLPFAPCIHLRALRKLPNLENWTAMCLFDDGWPSPEEDIEFEEEGGTVVMDTLRVVRIKEEEHYWGAIAQVLDHMSAPQLSELALDGNLDEDCISSVIDFIVRSNCMYKVKTLTLIDAGHSRGAAPFIPLLSKLPSLIELGLQYTSLPPPPPPPLPAHVNLLDDEADLLLFAGEVLPKGLQILILSDEMGLDNSILDGVKDARPGLTVRKVDTLEVR